MKNRQELLEEINFVKCIDCGKDIAIYTDNKRILGAATCNDCWPPNSWIRNGIDELTETDLYDKYNRKSLDNIKLYKEGKLKHLPLKDSYTLWKIWRKEEL